MKGSFVGVFCHYMKSYGSSMQLKPFKGSFNRFWPFFGHFWPIWEKPNFKNVIVQKIEFLCNFSPYVTKLKSYAQHEPTFDICWLFSYLAIFFCRFGHLSHFHYYGCHRHPAIRNSFPPISHEMWVVLSIWTHFQSGFYHKWHLFCHFWVWNGQKTFWSFCTVLVVPNKILKTLLLMVIGV